MPQAEYLTFLVCWSSGCDGGDVLPLPAPPRKQTAASEQNAGNASTDDGTGDANAGPAAAEIIKTNDLTVVVNAMKLGVVTQWTINGRVDAVAEKKTMCAGGVLITSDNLA